jgi:hypothetical protein
MIKIAMNKCFYPAFWCLFGQLEANVSKIREGNLEK